MSRPVAFARRRHDPLLLGVVAPEARAPAEGGAEVIQVIADIDAPEPAEEKINALGSIRYFEKPVDVDFLAECIMDELGSGAKGQLQGISLASFLQLIEIESKTCTLTVSAVGRKGTLTCLKGELTNAEVGELKGLKAAHEMVSWDTASIEISNTASNTDREINEPLMSIIMEGTRQKDEKADG